jgi:hypothetical protein
LLFVGCSDNQEGNEGIDVVYPVDITDENSDSKQVEGYIVGPERCSGVNIQGETGEAGGYYIVSTNLKDTLLTYNFPKDIFSFPVDFFHQTNLYRNKYKVQISYRIALEDELIYLLCPHNIYDPYNNGHTTQIIIKSANKIN